MNDAAEEAVTVISDKEKEITSERQHAVNDNENGIKDDKTTPNNSN